jgi:hypothetical protein
MNTQSDFEDFFRLLESNGVEYMIVGGYAVAFHGYPRFTKDIDRAGQSLRPLWLTYSRAAFVASSLQTSPVPLTRKSVHGLTRSGRILLHDDF